MSGLKHAESFRDLVVYQRARQLQSEIFEITRALPKDESCSLTSQIRRSSRSIGANIAEAWAKRRFEKHFISKLTDADGEQYETQHWIETASDCKYLDSETADSLLERYKQVGRLLGGMMQKAHLFCGEPYRTLHESTAQYFTRPTEDSDC